MKRTQQGVSAGIKQISDAQEPDGATSFCLLIVGIVKIGCFYFLCSWRASFNCDIVASKYRIMFDLKDNGYCWLMAFLTSWFRLSCVNQGCNYWFLVDLVWEVESVIPLIAAAWVFHGLLIRASCLFAQAACRSGHCYNPRGDWSPVVVQHRRLSGIRDILTSTVSYRFYAVINPSLVIHLDRKLALATKINRVDIVQVGQPVPDFLSTKPTLNCECVLKIF